jgi:hypothetical protein
MYVPQSVQELLELVVSMLSAAPRFLHNAGYLPFVNRDYVFRQLHEGLSRNRSSPGEQRYHELTKMPDRMRALFEADPEDKTGQTLQGCRIIHEMEDILKQVGRKS